MYGGFREMRNPVAWWMARRVWRHSKRSDRSVALCLVLFWVIAGSAGAQAPDAGPDSDVGLVPPPEILDPELGDPEEIEPLAWWAGELSLAIGGDYSSGDYGQREDTDMLYVPFTATYLFEELAMTPWGGDQLELQITMAYLRIRGEGTVLPGGDVPGGTALPRSTEQGFGDTIQFARYLPLVKQQGGNAFSSARHRSVG